MRYGMITGVLIAVSLAGCGRSSERQGDVAEQTCPEGVIKTHCVVSYQQGNTPYWTDQQQVFCPSSVLFKAWGTEPEGTWQCTLDQEQYTTSGLGGAYMKTLPAGLMNAALAELLYYSFTAGAGFEPSGMTPGEPVRIEGQRYEAFKIPETESGKTLTYYKNADTGQIELVQVSEVKGVIWLARSYNPRYNDRFKRMIPRKIDIFDTQQGISAKKLLIQFDYIDVQ